MFYLELIASACTILCVYQLSKENIWNFFWGGIAVLIFGFIFFEVKLYADMVLQWGYYLPITFFGWYWWYNKGTTRGDSKSLIPTVGSIRDWCLGALLLAVSVPLAGWFFATFTGAALPYPDSFILVASIYAQYLLSKKYVENWLIWIAVDAVAIPVYFIKGLYVTTGLYAILLCLATYGLIQWYKRWFDNEYVVAFPEEDEDRSDDGEVSPLPSGTRVASPDGWVHHGSSHNSSRMQ